VCPGTAGGRRDRARLRKSRQRAADRHPLQGPRQASPRPEANAARLAARLDKELLNLVEGIAYNDFVRRSLTTDPTLGELIDPIIAGLTDCPDYAGHTRIYFGLLLWEMVTFLAARHDLQRTPDLEYLRPYSGAAPREARLQADFADWLGRGALAGRVDVEVPNIATGRADIKVSFSTTRFYIEVKRELRDASKAALERSYLTQAADYAGTSAALGLLLVLDLTPHPDGVRHLSECAWLAASRPSGSEVNRYVVVGQVVGNRGTPRSYSN